MNLDPSEFAEKLLSYHRNELCEIERKRVEEILETNPELKKISDELTNKEEITSQLLLISSFDAEKALSKVMPQSRKIRFPYFQRVAAAAAVAVLISVSAYMYINRPEKQYFYTSSIQPDSTTVTLKLADGSVISLDTLKEYGEKDNPALLNSEGVLNVTGKLASLSGNSPVVMNKINVPFKTSYKIVLQDGTKVWLNAGTKLEFPSEFQGDIRKVILLGEAFFEVSKDPGKKFIIETNGLNVEVLGTSFNVKSYPDEGLIYTTLVTGSVSLNDNQGNSYKIYPGQQATYNKADKQLDIINVETAQYTAWKDGLFYFDSKPLDDILKRVGRWYGLDIEYKQARLKKIQYSGKMQMYDKVEDILHKFELSGGLAFTLENNSIIVSRPD